jgi:hypothetical protein
MSSSFWMMKEAESEWSKEVAKQEQNRGRVETSMRKLVGEMTSLQRLRVETFEIDCCKSLFWLTQVLAVPRQTN